MTAVNQLLAKLIGIINPESKEGLEALTALLILVFSLAFCYIFIIPFNLFDNWPEWLLYLVVIAIFYLLKFFLFSSDILYYGNPGKNKYVKAFQTYWPSKHIATKFNLSQEDAEFYWHENLFNTWREHNHPRHSQWERTLRRGYACRLVYYCIHFFGILLWISISVTLLQEILSQRLQMQVFASDISLGWKLGFIIFVALLYILIRLTNKTSPDNLTGVWRRYAEINQMHIKWIDGNIASIYELKNP